MALVLDAGALLAVDRGDAALRRFLVDARVDKALVIAGAGVVAQVWRRGAVQVHLSRVLRAVRVMPIDDPTARRIGELLALTGTRDVVDAHCALLARDGDTVLTSDPSDIKRLLFARGVRAQVHRV